MPIQVLPSFELPAGTTKAFFRNNYYQAADDLTLVRGRHQLGVGGNVAYFNGFYQSSSRAAGIWIFDGSATGLGLADLLLGRVTSVEHGAPAGPAGAQLVSGVLRAGHLARDGAA